MKKSIIGILSAVAGISVGAGVTVREMGKALDKTRKMSDKHLALFLMMNQWVKVKQEGKNLADYFQKKGYGKIAIYGMSYAGETLLDELKNTCIEVKYGIDKNAANLYADIEIVEPEEKLEKVDAIVVTSISFFDEIEEQLAGKSDCPIISLEDILCEL